MSTLEIEVGETTASGDYPVSVRSSAGGEASGSLRLDVDRLLGRRRELQAALLASAVPTIRGGVLGAQESPVREVGESLFAALMTGPVYGRYSAATAAAAGGGEPLRVVLRLQDPELAALPWEMLYDPESGYLCQQEPLIRHVQVPAPPPPAITPPLRLLGVVAAPRDLPALDATGEKARMTEALAGLGQHVHLTWAPAARFADLLSILLRGPWHAVHFIGHGDFDQGTGEGRLALENDAGNVDWVGAGRFAGLLSAQRPAPRLVVLNSCASGQAAVDDLFSSTAATLVRSGVPAVVAMQFAITDPAAKSFAAGFYQAIATNRSIGEAVRVGRIGISGTGTTLEWATPVLYLSGEETQDSPLFSVTALPALRQQPAPPSAETAARTAAVRALYQQAMARYRSQNYEEALPLFDSLLTLDPKYADAADRRATARTRQQAKAAYETAQTAERAGDWPTAISGYTAVLDLDPNHPDATQRRENCERRRHIADLQTELRMHADAEDWAAVIAVDTELADLDPTLADLDGLATSARQQLAKPGMAATPPNPTPPMQVAHPPHRQQEVRLLVDQLRERAAVRDWQAVMQVNDQLAALDPLAADVDGLATKAREHIRQQQEAERLRVYRQQQIRLLVDRMREHAAARNWQAVLQDSNQLTALDPQAADADGLATEARRQIRRQQNRQRTTVTKWSIPWALIPVVTFGFFMAAPFVHAVIVRRTSRTLLFSSFYGAATVMLWVSVAMSSTPGTQYNTFDYIGIALVFIVAPLATIHAFHIRRLVFSAHEKTDRADRESGRNHESGDLS